MTQAVPASRRIRTGDLEIHVTSWGDPTAPPVVLLHGMRDHGRSWDWTARALATRYHVICPDLRGHGDSDRAGAEGYGLPGFVLDIAEVADALSLDRYAIVGHSLGGLIGLRVAAAFPERVAALAGVESIETPLNLAEIAQPTPYPRRLRQWIEDRRDMRGRAPRPYLDIATARERMHSEQPTLTSETIAHLVQHGLVETAGGWRWKFDPIARHRAPDDQHALDLDAVLAAVACPVLMAYGDATWIPVPGQRRLRLLRNMRLSRYPGGSHWLHHEFRDRFIAEVDDFLEVNFPSS